MFKFKFYQHKTKVTLPAKDPDELSCTQGQIFSRNLHLPEEFGFKVTKHTKKERINSQPVVDIYRSGRDSRHPSTSYDQMENVTFC